MKAQASHSWIPRLAIPAMLLIAVVVVVVAVLQWRKQTHPQVTHPESAPATPPPAEAAQPIPNPTPAAPAVPSGEQAAALKQEAITVAETLARAYPDDPLTYALLGSAYYNTGRSDEATQYLNKCLELSPNLADAYDILARVAYEKGDPEETIRLCIEALKRGPATPEVANRMGRAQMDIGQTAEAVRTLQQAVRLPNATSESWYLLGQAHMQSGDYEKAREGFLKTMALVPDHTQACFGLFTACQRLGQTAEAEKYREQFQQLEAVDRRSLTDRSAQEDTLTGLPMVQETVARTLFGAAQIYRVHEQPAKAAELLFRSAALVPEAPVYRSALESFYLQRNEPAEGIKALQQLVAEQPDNGLNHLFLARLHSRLGQFKPAEQSFLKAQELAPRWADGYRGLAELYLRTQRKPDQARLMAGKAAELEPSGPHFHLLAVICAQNNDRVAALEALEKALAINPDEKQYQQLLQQLQQTP